MNPLTKKTYGANILTNFGYVVVLTSWQLGTYRSNLSVECGFAKSEGITTQKEERETVRTSLVMLLQSHCMKSHMTGNSKAILEDQCIRSFIKTIQQDKKSKS